MESWTETWGQRVSERRPEVWFLLGIGIVVGIGATTILGRVTNWPTWTVWLTSACATTVVVATVFLPSSGILVDAKSRTILLHNGRRFARVEPREIVEVLAWTPPRQERVIGFTLVDRSTFSFSIGIADEARDDLRALLQESLFRSAVARELRRELRL